MSRHLTGDVLQTSLVQMKQQQFNQQFNQKRQQLYRVWTSLHNYQLEGPYHISSLNNQVWYCDNKYCKHTQHGVYKKYKIPAWRSVQLGKGFVLCDGCIREYPRKQQNQQYLQQQQYQQPQYPQPNQYNQNIQKQNTYFQQQQHQPQYQQQLQPYQYQSQQFVNNTTFTQQDLNLVKSQPEGLNPGKMQNNNNTNNKNNMTYSTPQYPSNTNLNNTQTIRSTPLGPQMNNLNNNNTLQYSNYNQINSNNNINDNNSFYTVKEGWMMKQGNDFIKGWKRRYFYFYSNGNLIYFENNKSKKEKGRVNFMDATNIKKKKQQGFIVTTKKRNWQFVCKTQQIRDEWIRQIAAICRVPVV